MYAKIDPPQKCTVFHPIIASYPGFPQFEDGGQPRYKGNPSHNKCYLPPGTTADLDWLCKECSYLLRGAMDERVPHLVGIVVSSFTVVCQGGTVTGDEGRKGEGLATPSLT